MAVSLSLVVVFGGVLGFLLRFRAVSVGSAFVATGFGFYLASTGAAEPINEFNLAVIQALGEL
ncbi:hypothetical protein [Streptomyces buecherae]|uniref:hypothetical protein n=1 Tax=Streptomyces buecherae TaxID=2763006 RepID=UPI001C252F2A|nr:hypothetical protein [Streptomyces buecherae]